MAEQKRQDSALIEPVIDEIIYLVLHGIDCEVEHVHQQEDISPETWIAVKAKILAIVEGEHEQMQGDPDYEMCHGRGCPECNDSLYYQQQDFMEQYRRDRAYDRSGAVSPYGEQP